MIVWLRISRNVNTLKECLTLMASLYLFKKIQHFLSIYKRTHAYYLSFNLFLLIHECFSIVVLRGRKTNMKPCLGEVYS